MNEENPIVSIITVCYNCQDTIEKTIESVISQTYQNIEYIIIDGGSTDATLAAIGCFNSRISLVISEKDSGIYDAMNKGLRHARGEIIYFLNSGDHVFAQDTIEKIVAVFHENPGISLVHGDAVMYGETPDEYQSMGRKNPIIYFTQGLCHQTLFARRRVFETAGNFDTRFSVFGDRDWLFRSIFRNKEKIMHVTLPVCYSLTGGFSSRQDVNFFREKIRLLLKFSFDKQVILLLLRNPRELIRFKGIILYSLMRVISLSLFIGDSAHGRNKSA
jgi:glycosyltransferase involved in cell wall biosynthesis